MEKGTGRRRKRTSSNKSKKIIVGIASLGVVSILGITFFSMSVQGLVKSWDNRIYPGVFVQDIDLGGMTKEEATEILYENLQEAIKKKVLSIKIGDEQFELMYSDITPSYDITKIVDKAYDFGKEHGTLMKYKNIKNIGDQKNEIEVDFSYDEDKLKEYEEKIKEEVDCEAENATLKIDGTNISVLDGSDGKVLNIDYFHEKIKESLNGNINSNDNIDIELETQRPSITREDLEKINGIIGTFSSDYGTSAPGRSKNIEIATEAIDGTIVMPGEVFSFNDVVGPRTEERGYKEAGTYVGNKVEPGIGGGICQVSTAIYRAAMRANLRSVERTNHSMAVGYAKPGLDATVSYGYLDYKFKNSYDCPIYIQGITYGKVVTYNIYGDTDCLEGKTYDMANEILETLPPEVKIVEDNTLPQGQEISEGGGMTGYRARSYQITYENGVEINREPVATDTYARVDTIVRKGTKAPEPDPQVVPATPEGGETQAPPATDSTAPEENSTTEVAPAA